MAGKRRKTKHRRHVLKGTTTIRRENIPDFENFIRFILPMGLDTKEVVTEDMGKPAFFDFRLLTELIDTKS